VSETPVGEATTRSFGILQGGKTCACGGRWGSRASKTRLAIARKGGRAYGDGRLRIEKGNSGLLAFLFLCAVTLFAQLNLATLVGNISD
jgi:hypothetical protein